MAKKRPVLARVLEARSVGSVAFGEIASSLFIALGIVALYAGALLPWVLLAVGIVFFLVTLSYAEGTAALPETGGGAMLVRRAFNDPAGFLTGWVLLLDYVIVIALAALFVPHYAGAAIGWDALTRQPWDGLIGIGVIATVAAARLARRSELYRVAVVVAAVALATQILLIVLGLAFLFDSGDLTAGLDLGTSPHWGDLAFALALAALAYTGLETVANYAAETREPGRTLPRSLFVAVGAVVALTFLVGLVGVSVDELGGSWRRAPLVGFVAALDARLPNAVVDVLRVAVGLSGVVVLVATITTSISGVGRLTHSLGRHQMLPRAFARLSARTLIAPPAIISAAGIAAGLLLLTDLTGQEVRFLASLYSFGVLLAFVAAQLAVLRLRRTEPDLERPYRTPLNLRIRGVDLPLPALVGAPLAFILWLAAIATHDAARIAGPLWLVAGAILYAAVRRAEGATLLEHVVPAEPDLVPEPEGAYARILVPLKLGPIGEEVLATAVRLAEERGSAVRVLHVIRVPLELPLDAELPEQERAAEESLAEVREMAEEHGVELEAKVVRARALGEAIVAEAAEQDAELVILGSAPRWRRQSRFFSPTVDYVLRKAPSEVMVVTYPQGVLEDTTVEA
jgi:basic amino acid/polyamine antiporter, APA family